jgi:DNA ligase 1
MFLRSTSTATSLLLRCHPLPAPKTLALAAPPPFLLPSCLLRPRLSSAAASSASPRRRTTAAAADAAKSGEKRPTVAARVKRAGEVPAPAAAGMSASGGNGGKRTVADVLMGNARAAASKAKKAAPSPKKARTQPPAAQADGEGAELAAEVEKAPSPARSKRASSPSKSPKSAADGATTEVKGSPANSAAAMKLGAKKSSSPKKSRTLAAKSDTKLSDKGDVSQTDGKKKRSPSPTKAIGLASQPEEKEQPSSTKKAIVAGTAKSEEKNTTLELKKKGSEFDPMAAAYWNLGEPVPFLFLARALDLISNESGRIVITEILSNVFRTVIDTTPDDLLATVYLAANRIAPPHEGIELGIGDASIIRALAEAYGRKEEHVKKNLKVV